MWTKIVNWIKKLWSAFLTAIHKNKTEIKELAEKVVEGTLEVNGGTLEVTKGNITVTKKESTETTKKVDTKES